MLTIGNESFVLDAVSLSLERRLKIRLVPKSTASAVLRREVCIFLADFIWYLSLLLRRRESSRT